MCRNSLTEQLCRDVRLKMRPSQCCFCSWDGFDCPGKAPGWGWPRLQRWLQTGVSAGVKLVWTFLKWGITSTASWVSEKDVERLQMETSFLNILDACPTETPERKEGCNHRGLTLQVYQTISKDLFFPFNFPLNFQFSKTSKYVFTVDMRVILQLQQKMHPKIC